MAYDGDFDVLKVHGYVELDGTTQFINGNANDIAALLKSLDAAPADALTAQLTTITHTAPGADDFAIQGVTQTTPFGFATANEGNTVLKVIANLQTRVAEIEARLEALGLVTAN